MDISAETIHELVQKQRDFFKSGKTLDIKWRKAQLLKLKKAVLENEEIIEEALARDLCRSKEEAYFCDIGSVILEINEALSGLSRWERPEHHFSGICCFPSLLTTVYKMPYGVCLIISPFNFPFMLSFGVLTAAIAGGNTAIIKASSKSRNCTAVLKDIIGKTFEEEYISVVGGGHDAADMLLSERFDKIFYTGSPSVARHIAEMAAKNLTPIALELGGETGNWCIVRKDADIKDAARKIAFFKLCNSGQICIDINQVAVEESVAEEFVKELKKAFIKQIGENALQNPEYPCLISEDAYEKCEREAALHTDRFVFGGKGDKNTRKFAPTIIYPVEKNEAIVNHELFNPLLPVVPFGNCDEILNTIEEREHGLALYIFTKDVKWAKKVMKSLQYGGGCINEVCLHLMVKGAPFNGTGHSGMGAYHGEWGFREFTHPSTVLTGSTRFNLPLREHPYAGKKLKFALLKLFER